MEFKRSFCTNTRLIGMMMLAIEWIQADGEVVSHVFMLDAEGLGISDFYEIKDCSQEEKEAFYHQKYGGLGGILVSLTEDEARFIVLKYLDKNLRYEKEVPEEFYCIDMYKEKDVSHISSKHMMDILIKKMESEKEFINYMVLRFIARDREGLMYFSNNETLSNLHITEINGTLLLNRMQKKGEDRYLCTCVFEDKDGYYEADLVIHIDKTVRELKDNLHERFETKYSLRSIMILEKRAIYDFEAFEIISKKEHLDMYKLNSGVDMSEIGNKLFEISKGIQEIEADNGNIYIQYFSDNSHLDEEEYIINNDIMFLAYLNEDRLFLATYNPRIKDLLDEKIFNHMEGLISFEDSFNFEQNALYDFIESGNDDFYDFIDVD